MGWAEGVNGLRVGESGRGKGGEVSGGLGVGDMGRGEGREGASGERVKSVEVTIYSVKV